MKRPDKRQQQIKPDPRVSELFQKRANPATLPQTPALPVREAPAPVPAPVMPPPVAIVPAAKPPIVEIAPSLQPPQATSPDVIFVDSPRPVEREVVTIEPEDIGKLESVILELEKPVVAKAEEPVVKPPQPDTRKLEPVVEKKVEPPVVKVPEPMAEKPIAIAPPTMPVLETETHKGEPPIAEPIPDAVVIAPVVPLVVAEATRPAVAEIVTAKANEPKQPELIEGDRVFVWLKPIPEALKSEITRRTYRIGEYAFWQESSADKPDLRKANNYIVDVDVAKMLVATGEIEIVEIKTV